MKMNYNKLGLISLAVVIASCSPKKDVPYTIEASPKTHLYMDVHNIADGKVAFDDVSGAHQKDLATQEKYGAHFIKYWVDENQGKVYCLVEAPDSAAVYKTHKEAHGLTPDNVRLVSDGVEAKMMSNGNLFFDVHYLGAGNVTAKAVEDAHVKDLMVQGKYGVNFVNYWVNEEDGVVMCVAEAPDSGAMVKTHKEAHGLIPDEVHQVKQGN